MDVGRAFKVFGRRLSLISVVRPLGHVFRFMIHNGHGDDDRLTRGDLMECAWCVKTEHERMEKEEPESAPGELALYQKLIRLAAATPPE